jgi:hypothetical protein
MAAGKTIESTGTSGFRTELRLIGLHTATGTGRSLPLGVGRGWKTSLGDLRHSIMGAGRRYQAEVGVGCPGPCQLPAPSTCDRCMRQRWWRLLEEEL